MNKQNKVTEDDFGRFCPMIRVLPIGGGGNVLIGRASYEQEMDFRRELIRAGVPFDLPTWESLRIYWTGANGLEGGQ